MSKIDRPPGLETEDPASPGSDSGVESIGSQGKIEDSVDIEGEQEFDWELHATIQHQPAIAIYWASRRQLIIRSQRWPDEDEVIYIDRRYLDRLIGKLVSMRDGNR